MGVADQRVVAGIAVEFGASAARGEQLIVTRATVQLERRCDAVLDDDRVIAATGVRICDLPIAAEKVLAGLRKAGKTA